MPQQLRINIGEILNKILAHHAPKLAAAYPKESAPNERARGRQALKQLFIDIALEANGQNPGEYNINSLRVLLDGALKNKRTMTHKIDQYLILSVLARLYDVPIELDNNYARLPNDVTHIPATLEDFSSEQIYLLHHGAFHERAKYASELCIVYPHQGQLVFTTIFMVNRSVPRLGYIHGYCYMSDREVILAGSHSRVGSVLDRTRFMFLSRELGAIPSNQVLLGTIHTTAKDDPRKHINSCAVLEVIDSHFLNGEEGIFDPQHKTKKNKQASYYDSIATIAKGKKRFISYFAKSRREGRDAVELPNKYQTAIGHIIRIVDIHQVGFLVGSKNYDAIIHQALRNIPEDLNEMADNMELDAYHDLHTLDISARNKQFRRIL